MEEPYGQGKAAGDLNTRTQEGEVSAASKIQIYDVCLKAEWTGTTENIQI